MAVFRVGGGHRRACNNESSILVPGLPGAVLGLQALSPLGGHLPKVLLVPSPAAAAPHLRANAAKARKSERRERWFHWGDQVGNGQRNTLHILQQEAEMDNSSSFPSSHHNFKYSPGHQEGGSVSCLGTVAYWTVANWDHQVVPFSWTGSPIARTSCNWHWETKSSKPGQT